MTEIRSQWYPLANEGNLREQYSIKYQRREKRSLRSLAKMEGTAGSILLPSIDLAAAVCVMWLGLVLVLKRSPCAASETTIRGPGR